VGHDGRNPAAVPAASGTWPHRPILPTVDVSPNVVRRQMYFSPKFLFDHLFFENHDKINIYKKTRYVPVRCYGHKISINVIQRIQIFKIKYSKYSIKKISNANE
jgi:hypothetical protein